MTTPREALYKLGEHGVTHNYEYVENIAVGMTHNLDVDAILTALREAGHLRTPGTVEVCSLCHITPINNCGGVDDGGIKSPCPIKQVTK